MIEGACFCGSIRYQIRGRLVNARSCHCSLCRKAFSGAGSAYAEVEPPDSLEWTEGADRLQVYRTQADWGLGFCRSCGSTLCGVYRDQIHGITLGPVNGDPGVQIEKHIFVGSKAPWDHIGGDAPQYDEHEP